MVIDLNQPVLPDDHALLDDLQCNTLAPHRRNLSVHLFFRLGDDPVKNRAYLQAWAGRATPLRRQVGDEKTRLLKRRNFVAAAFASENAAIRMSRWLAEKLGPQWAEQWRQAQYGKFLTAFHETEEADRSLVRSVMISPFGLMKLDPWQSGATGADSQRYPVQDRMWAGGMFSQEKFLSIGGLDYVNLWSPDYWVRQDPQTARRQAVDVHVLLAEDGDLANGRAQPQARTALQAALAEELTAIQGAGGSLVAQRWGYLSRQIGGGYQEHFGFRDGISGVHTLEGERQQARSESASPDLGTTLGNVLFELPLPAGGTAYGSLCVFREIEERLEAAAGANLNSVIGRQPDGKPLLPSVKDDGFDYAADMGSAGTPPRCPFHAHIRKANPRKSSPEKAIEAGVLLARRGMLYGDRAFDPTTCTFGAANGAVGLLFMAYMRSIEGQFALMQRQWLAEPGFPQPSTPPSPDQLVGLLPTNPLSGLTVVRGGEYFFVPPLSWLQAPGPRP